MSKHPVVHGVAEYLGQPTVERVDVAVRVTFVTDVLDSANESWGSAAAQDSDGLADLLGRLHRWETDFDPDGMVLPRSKQHDDKAIAVLRFL
ncbi:hypothetical protein ACFVJ5_23795 [Nocardia sp. NPDC127606]|uniref:hypothetical protein n=1 Tax=Nocardia sp. NPDC127606 TaxID=3345406 RepID=UPI003642A3F2